MTPVGRQWANALLRLQEAALASEIMVSTTAGGRDRDLATARYVTAVDALVADLISLKEAGVLLAITVFLAGAVSAASDPARQGRS